MIAAKKNEHNKQNSNVIINSKFKELIEYSSGEGEIKRFIITYWLNPADQKLYLFKSNYISYEEYKNLIDNDIKEFPVIYEANNIKKYEIDTKILKETRHESNE